MIFYMGGVAEHSSNMPDPVALLSAEAEYNESCLAFTATSHLKQFLEDLELPFADDKKSKKQLRSSLTTEVQLTWVQVSRIHREQDI
jgi:hypothetical protein